MAMTAKTILVTGASAGFGAATARRFAQAGWRVVACARRGFEAEDVGWLP